MSNHFRMCASAYREGEVIDVTVYAGLPDGCHDGKITGISLEDPEVLEIFISFARRSGPCENTMIWTWASRCVVPYNGQTRVELIGTFEGKSFRLGAQIPDSKPNYVACGFMVIARNVEHSPRLGCLSVLGGTEIPEGYSKVYPQTEQDPDSRADCEAWRQANCA